jgi:hypothetical protein
MPKLPSRDVSSEDLRQIQMLIAVLDGGAIAEALMSLVLSYERRGVAIDRLKKLHPHESA